MSESEHPFSTIIDIPAIDTPVGDSASGVPSQEPSAPAMDAPPVGAASSTAPSFALETVASLDLLGQGLAPDADPATRAAARDACERLLARLGGRSTAAPVGRVPAAAAPVTLPPSSAMAMVPMPVAMPPSPLAALVGTLRSLPPEQLLDLALQRLRAALPAGVTVAEPKGIQFPLVPVTTASHPGDGG